MNRLARAAFLLPLLVGVSFWVIDAMHLALPHRPAGRQLVLGLGVALLFVLGAALPFGLLTAALTWLGLSGSRAGAPRLSALLARLHDARGQQAAQTGSALLCAFVLCVLLYLVATLFITEQTILHMARPHFAALAVAATQLLLALCLAVLFAPFVALSSLLVRAAYRVPHVGAALFGKPLRLAVLFTGCAVAACLALLVQYRAALRYLPWRSIEWWGIALLVSVSALWFASALPMVRRILAGLSLAALSVAVWAAIVIAPHDRAAHDVVERRLSSGRTALSILQFLGDFDRDGHLAVLGGDCAAWDPAVHPGALDIPGNGRDEDCDGSDAVLGTFTLTSSVDHPVPSDVPLRPPILLITVDAFAASHMGSFGYERMVTPELDAFARRSALFRSCYAQGPSTRLSLPALFMSQWDSKIEQELVGVHPYPLRSSGQLLAELLRSAGYDTTAILSENYFTPERWQGLTNGFDTLSRAALEQQGPHNARAVSDATLRALSAASDKPKFVWAHYFDAHPLHERPRGIASYGDAEIDLYDAELRFVDREIGRLLRQVDELLHGQALIVITADHGFAFDEPRHGKAHYGYDLSSAVLHVPLIIHAPFVPPRAFDQVVSAMDIAPTLINLLRLQPPRPLYGSSLVAELLSGATRRGRTTFHQLFLLERAWQGGDPLSLVSVRTDRFNLIHDRARDQYELYDYRKDPLETNDLTLSGDYRTIYASLKNTLRDFTYAVHQSGRQAASTVP